MFPAPRATSPKTSPVTARVRIHPRAIAPRQADTEAELPAEEREPGGAVGAVGQHARPHVARAGQRDGGDREHCRCGEEREQWHGVVRGQRGEPLDPAERGEPDEPVHPDAGVAEHAQAVADAEHDGAVTGGAAPGRGQLARHCADREEQKRRTGEGQCQEERAAGGDVHPRRETGDCDDDGGHHPEHERAGAEPGQCLRRRPAPRGPAGQQQVPAAGAPRRAGASSWSATPRRPR